MACCATAGIAAAPLVHIAQGDVSGQPLVGGGALFKGIPYAASTAGDGRWRPPGPPPSWTGRRDAARYGAMCPQAAEKGSVARDLPQSEDCLTINVATPRVGGSQRLPVLVLVHGGAFAFGSGADRFEASAETYVKRGIVVVAMNYRVGRFGFFAHPGLRAEQAGAPVGNYWLMDQLAALRWVRDNIAGFGGDPKALTILGCSAGGSSINSLMVTPASRGLFVHASAHSGGGIVNATRPLARAEEQGVAFQQRAGVAGEGVAAIAGLRRLSPAQILAADPGPPDYGAIVDGQLLPEDISAAFAGGRIAHVPFLVGSTSNEASVFGLMGFDADVLKRRFGIDLTEQVPLYGVTGPELLRQVQTDFLFTAGATLLGGLANRSAPAWAYHFAYVPQEKPAPGAPHCADMGYTFGYPDTVKTAADRHVADTLQAYLANFVKTGDPNSPGLPAWPRDAGADRPLLLIDDKNIVAVPDFRKRQLDGWYRAWGARTGLHYP